MSPCTASPRFLWPLQLVSSRYQRRASGRAPAEQRPRTARCSRAPPSIGYSRHRNPTMVHTTCDVPPRVAGPDHPPLYPRTTRAVLRPGWQLPPSHYCAAPALAALIVYVASLSQECMLSINNLPSTGSIHTASQPPPH